MKTQQQVQAHLEQTVQKLINRDGVSATLIDIRNRLKRETDPRRKANYVRLYNMVQTYMYK